MQFKSFETGIEVSGESLGAIVDGFRKYPSVAMKYLTRFGLVKNEPGHAPSIIRNAWYSLDQWLAAYEGIAEEIGYNSLYGIGRSIPENATFPAEINDVYSAVASIDIAYHLNHRKNGVVMFNPKNGEMLEGIGHYRSQPVANENRIVCVCENPYPCDFDRGIISAMAGRFMPDAKTVHDSESVCRKKGADSCTYIVWW